MSDGIKDSLSHMDRVSNNDDTDNVRKLSSLTNSASVMVILIV